MSILTPKPSVVVHSVFLVVTTINSHFPQILRVTSSFINSRHQDTDWRRYSDTKQSNCRENQRGTHFSRCYWDLLEGEFEQTSLPWYVVFPTFHRLYLCSVKIKRSSFPRVGSTPFTPRDFTGRQLIKVKWSWKLDSSTRRVTPGTPTVSFWHGVARTVKMGCVLRSRGCSDRLWNCL